MIDISNETTDFLLFNLIQGKVNREQNTVKLHIRKEHIINDDDQVNSKTNCVSLGAVTDGLTDGVADGACARADCCQKDLR